MQLHYQIQGHHQAQPLLFLHGLFGSADNWGTIAKHFAQHYQVITVDLRNHGRSPHSDSQTFPEMAADVAETLDALGIDRVHLIGHSLGGKVAMQFASLYAERIHTLTVVDIATRAYADAHTHLIDAMQALNVQQMSSRQAAEQALSAQIPSLMVRQFLLTNLVKHENQLHWRIPLSALKANYRHFQAALAAHSPRPTLFIRGARSDYVRESDIADMQQQFTQATFVTLHTDHWVHAEQPQLFIQAIEDFLSGLNHQG